jgi:hypothetical protein
MSEGVQKISAFKFRYDIHYVTTVSLSISMSLQSALHKLASFRTNNTRESQETFQKGLIVLKSAKPATLGDEGGEFNISSRPRQLTFPRMGIS